MADEASTTDEKTTEEHEAPKPTTSEEKTPVEKTGKTYDEAYVKELRQESAGYRTRLREAEAERDQLKERVSSLEGESSGASSKLSALETEKARLEVALDKGLPKELVSRLVGNTPEELSADAEALLALVTPTGSGPKVSFDGGTRKGVDAPDLATRISEAEKAGDLRSSIALKAQMARETRDRTGPNGALSPLPKS
jgi:hypothetical protein